ncbi:MAG: right-handed parallel beta-helix repeat-containing protein [Chloroflexota bacterium]
MVTKSFLTRFKQGNGVLLLQFVVVVVIVLALALPPSSALAATPIYVRTDGSDSECDGTADAPYPGGSGPLPCAVQTIQTGVNLADPGGTVFVAAGTYYEANITIDKSVTIVGDPGDASAGPGPSAPVIDGGSSPGDAFLIDNGVSDVLIQGFEIQNYTSDDTGIGNGVSAWEASTSNITIQDNYFHDLGWNAVLVGNDGALGDHTNWTLKNNIVEDYVAYGLELTNASDSSFEGNVIHANNSWTAILVVARRNESGITIRQNVIDGSIDDVSGSGRAAIYLLGWDIETPGVQLDTVTLENNEISTTGTKPHILVYGVTTGVVTNVTVRDNSFASLRNVAAHVDASANWWGDLSPSDNIIASTGPVDYTPWLNSGADTSTDPGFQGDFSVLNVDDDSPQTGSVGRIQEGVNLVTASTVNLAPGTYVEQVEITQPVTLNGSGQGVTIIESPTTLSEYFTTSANNYPIVYVHGTDNVTIRHLTVDGAGKGNSNYRFVGIGYSDAGGMIDDVAILDVRDTPISGSQHGVGILASADTGTPRSLTINDSVLNDYQKNGMVLTGVDLTVTVTDNTVTGAGAVNFIAQNGIQVSGGATAEIEDNTVSGHSYTPFSWVSTGMLLYGAGPTNTSGNVVSENQVGIYVIDTPGNHDGNTVSASSAGTGSPYFWGIVVDSPPPAHVPSPYEVEPESNAEGPQFTIQALTSSVQTVTVTNNVLTGDGTASGIGLEADSGFGLFDIDLTATNNFIQDWGVGVEIYECSGSCTGTTFSNLNINLNSITGNLFGFDHYSATFTADGERNWWGSASGPTHASNPGGAGDAASDDVDFDPWLCNGVDTSAAIGFQPDTSVLCTAPSAGALVINEVDYDQASTDTAEFIEIKNVSGGAVDLDAYQLKLVNGASGGAAVYETIDLPAVSLAAGDYFVVCGDAANVPNCDLDVTPNTNLVQNGAPDAVGLFDTTTSLLVDAVSYEGDTGAPYTEGSGTGLEDDGSVTGTGLSRYPDGTDTQQNNVDFSLRCISPGAANLAAASDCVGSITIVKEAVDGDVGDNPTFAFHGSLGDFDLNFSESQTFGNLPPGDYTITETVPNGWHLDIISCVPIPIWGGPVVTPVVGGATISLEGGDDVTCTYYNRYLHADLSVTKSEDVDPVIVGQPLTYTVAVTNNGPDAAENVVVSDTLPSGVTYDSATATQGSCVIAFPLLECQIGTMNPGDSVTVTIHVTPNEGGTMTNHVAVASDTNDPDTGNNSDSEDTTVIATGTITIVKQADAAGTFDFTGDLGNFSLNDGGSTTFNDVTAGVYSVSEADPAPGFVLTGLSCDDANSTADAGARTAEIHLEPAEHVTCTFVNETADPQIEVDKDGPLIAEGDQPITYTYTVTNPGNAPLGSVSVSDDKCSPVAYQSGDDGDNLLEPGEAWVFTCTYTPSFPESDHPLSSSTKTGGHSHSHELTNTATASGQFADQTLQAQDSFTLYPLTLIKEIYLYWSWRDDKSSVRYGLPDNTYFTLEARKNNVVVGTFTFSQDDPLLLWLSKGTFIFKEINMPYGYRPVYTNPLTYVAGRSSHTTRLFPNLIQFDLAVEKTGPETARKGDTITYTYAVTNSGPALVTPRVTDNKCSPLTYTGGDTDLDGLVDPGETWIFECRYRVTTKAGKHVTNIARVTDANAPPCTIGGDLDLSNNKDYWRLLVVR